MTLPVEETITELASSDRPLVNTRLTELTNLSLAELECFQRRWGTIEEKRRRQIVHRLVELAESNLELDFDSILKYCLEDEDAAVRRQAIEGLWENEEPSLIDPLIKRLEADNSEQVRAAAATALGRFALLAEHKKLRSCYLVRLQEALLTVISDHSQPLEIRRRALEASAPLSLPQVKKAIMEAYQSQNPKLRISAIYAMGKNCDDYWLPILLKELSSNDSEARYEAAVASGEMEAAAAVTYLIKLVNGPDIDIQMAALQALGKIGSTEARECLERCRGSISDAIHEAAEQALLELEGRAGPLSFQL